VDGVYTRGGKQCRPLFSLPTSVVPPACSTSSGDGDSHVQSSASPVEHMSSASASSHTGPAAGILRPPLSSSAVVSTGIPLPVTTELSSLPCSVVSGQSPQPPKVGIVPPTAARSVNSPPVGASQFTFEADTGWKEFEEALSDEFISFASTADTSIQLKDDVPTSLPRQPLLKPPGFVTPSTAFSYQLPGLLVF